MRAESLEVAASALRSKLCQIDELVPLPDEGQAVEVGRLESSFAKLDAGRRVLVAVLSVICLTSVYSWVKSPAAVAFKPDSKSQVVHFKATGELNLEAVGRDPSEWTVFVVFPELPLEVGGPLEQDQALFSFSVEYEGTNRPSKAVVDVQRDGRRWRLPGSAPVPTSGDLDLGLLAVTELKELDPGSPLPPSRPGLNEEAKPTGHRLTRTNYHKALQAKYSGRRRR